MIDPFPCVSSFVTTRGPGAHCQLGLLCRPKTPRADFAGTGAVMQHGGSATKTTTSSTRGCAHHVAQVLWSGPNPLSTPGALELKPSACILVDDCVDLRYGDTSKWVLGEQPTQCDPPFPVSCLLHFCRAVSQCPCETLRQSGRTCTCLVEQAGGRDVRPCGAVMPRLGIPGLGSLRMGRLR